MKLNIRIIVTAVIAVIAGIVAGYLIFGSDDSQTSSTEVHAHDGGMDESGEEQIWTCSMHPQIRQNEPGQCPICGMDLIPLSQSTTQDPMVLEMTEEAVKLANIQTTTVGEETGRSGNTVRLTGKVQADERRASTQVAHVPGRIERLHVTFTGEQVTRGQKLADVYSPELITAQRELLEALKLQDVNPGLLEAARNKLRYWKIGSEAIESVEESGEIQETFPLYADETAVVMKRLVAVGDYVRQGEPLFDLINLGEVWVLFDAYEEDLASISVGDRIEFTTSSRPGRTFRTRVTFIDPVINPNTRVASLRAEVSNAGRLLKPEMLVYGTLKKNAVAKSELTVPKSAVLWTGERSVVYVHIPGREIPSYEFREVQLGEGLGDSYAVLNGVEAGDEVVTYGNFAIDAAAQLNNQMSMMNRRVVLKGSEDNVELLPDYTETTPAAFKGQILGVTNAYLKLKNALVATDPEQAALTAATLQKSLNAVDMSLVADDAHLYWMEQLSAIRGHSAQIAGTQEVEEQRSQFDFLSQALIKTVKAFGILEDTLYVQYCPMAIDNKGAYWISEQETIRNPYFGQAMLTCGSTEEVLK